MKSVLQMMALMVSGVTAFAGVVTYPAPPGEALSEDYQVWADGQKVDVYVARVLDPPFAGKEYDYGGPYSLANFDLAGACEVRITSKRSLRGTVVRPAWPDITTRMEGDNTLLVALPGPRKLSIEPDGKKGLLLLFANPPEENAPKPNSPGVIYFGPGIHQAGRILITNGQTLYLAGGAVVKGGVIAQGENIRITGRGILDSSDYEWRKGPTPHIISIRGTNIEVSGITIRGASHWTVVPRDSRNVTVRGVKICGGRVQNDDGINPCNSQDVLITDCFIRSDDDCVALKGLDFSTPNSNVERITVENCTLWCDRARIFLLGHESRAPFMRGITLRNLDIIHFTMTPFLFEPGEEMQLEDVTVENVRMFGEGQGELMRLKPVVNQYMRNKVPGRIRDVRFRNVTLSGKPGAYRVQIAGADEKHDVRGVTLDNVELLGVKLNANSERMQVGKFTEGIQFDRTTEPLYLLTYDHGGLVLWGAEHFAERLRNAISWLDRYPSFKIGLENEAWTYDALAEQNPKLLEEIRGYLKRYAGRFGIATSTYGQPLSSFINDESNVRQLVYAIRADQRHFGYTPIIYLMSEHAMHSQMPQLLEGCGFRGAILRTHFMMYGYNPTFDAPIGWWSGLDGSRLPAVPTYPGEGAEFGRTTVDNWFLTRYPSKDAPKSPDDFRQQFAHIHPLLATRADDSGLRREELVKQCEGKPEYRWLLLDELQQTFPKPTVEFKTQPNDFVVRMPWGYCGNEIWNTNRQAEVQVLAAERLAALELLLGGTNREPDLETAWKNLLVAQHHDVQICGLLAEAHRFLPASLAASRRVRDGAMQFFASRMKGDGLLQVTAFNPLSWRRTQSLSADLSFTQKGEAKSIRVQQGGQGIPSALLAAERYSDGSLMTARVGFPADLPGLGVAAYSVSASKTNGALDGRAQVISTQPPANAAAATPLKSEPQKLTVMSPFYEARLDPAGGIASLMDKTTGKPLFKPERRSGFLAGTIDGEEQESKGQWLLPAAGEDAPSLTAREDGHVGKIPYTFELTFHAGTPRLDCRVQFHFAGQKIGRVSTNQRDAVSPFLHEQKLRFKLFPMARERATGVRDLPFAISETTNRYVQGNYWTAVTDGQFGVAVFNRGTMGSTRENDGGFSVPLAYAMYYVWGTRMLDGDFSYEFAVYPFTGDWRQSDLHRRALEYNFPVVSVSGPPGNGLLGSAVRPLEAGSENVILSAFYPEAGHVLARFYEYQGRRGEMPLALAKGSSKLESVDLLGHKPHAVATPLSFQPWQIRTIRVEPDVR